uniref:Uncharacterized protein n=1 Tax=Arundo donax TaxID=35708 RepID=A0A0A9DRA9_ARUDO
MQGRGNCTVLLLISTHRDCRLLSSPIADEISPPRFRFDRFLYFQGNNLITRFFFSIKQINKKTMLLLRQRRFQEQNF